MQKARRRSRSDRLQTNGFRFFFTPLSGVLPTFPSRYWSTIGLPGVFSLAGWSPPVQAGFLVSRPTQVLPCRQQLCPYGGVTRSARPFQTVRVLSLAALGEPYYPACAATHAVWAPSVSIATTPDIDSFFLFLRVLRCFSSPRSPRPKAGDGPSARRVAPFGLLRISARLQLPADFRSFPRPSSPPEA